MFASRTRSPAVNQVATLVAKRFKSSKSIEISLRANVQGLGKPGDVVSVKPGLMRNRLYPLRLANYIGRLDHLTKDAEKQGQTIAKEMKAISDSMQQQARKDNRIVQLQQIRNRLQTIGPLVFVRAVNEILPGSRTIFGSVQADDVIRELREKHGIVLDASHQKLTVQGTKIKTLGESWAKVDLADLGSVQLRIVVERK